MLAEVNEFLRKPVTRAEIVWSYSGVRPLFETGGGRDGDLKTLTRDYSFEIDRQRRPGAGADRLWRQAHHASPPCGACNAEAQRHHALAGLGPIAHGHSAGRRFRCGVASMPIARPYKARALVAGNAGKSLCSALWHAHRRLARGRRKPGPNWARSSAPISISGRSISSRETEWAVTVEDIIWRRSKLGLRLSPVEIGRLASYLKKTS